MVVIRGRKQKKKQHQPEEKKHLAISHKMDKTLMSQLEMFRQRLRKQTKKPKTPKKPKMPQEPKNTKNTKRPIKAVGRTGAGGSRLAISHMYIR